MNSIQTICEETYGVSVVMAPVNAILWAAWELAEDDPDAARKELKKANRLREKHGRPLAYAPHGHPAF